MNCPFCSTENPDGAAFCKHCGMPMSGLVDCPVCGAKTPADGEFCVSCGARFPHPTPAAATAAPAEPAARPWQNALVAVGNALAILAALCAVVFIFCIGCTYRIDTVSDVYEMEQLDLYKYFREIYVGIQDELTTGTPQFYTISRYTTAVFGTVIAAGALITVPVLFLVALIRYLTGFAAKGSRKKPVLAIGAATYFLYLAFTLLFAALHAQGYEETVRGTQAGNACVVLNGVSIAGLVLGGIFLVVSAVCHALGKGKALLCRDGILRICFSAAGILLACTALVLSAGCVAGYSLVDGTSTERISFHLMQGLAYAGELDDEYGNRTSILEQYPEDCLPILIASVLGFLLLIALAVLTAVLLTKLIKGVGGEKYEKHELLKYLILCTIFAILFAVCVALVSNHVAVLAETLIGNNFNIRSNFGMAIAVPALYAVALILYLVYNAVSSDERLAD